MLNRYIRFLQSIPPARLRWFLVAVASLIATRICYIQHGWINNDTVLYLEAARLFSGGHWHAGFEIFPWPLYSLLIAGIHQLTGFDLHFAAQVLNVFFFSLTTYFFIRLITLAGGENLTVASGALILFSSHYVVGDVMEMLMRDQGFWAFFLASLLFFIQFSQSHHWKDALLWQISIMVATLFRIEGITYLIALPLVLLFNQSEKIYPRIKLMLISQALPLVIALGMVLAFQFNQQLNIEQLGRLKEIFNSDLLHQLTALFQHRRDIFADKVLGNFLDDYASMALLFSFALIIVHKIIASAGLVNIVLATFSIYRKTIQPHRHVFTILTGAFLIGLIDAQLIILKVFVLSSRYLVPLVLICMVFAAFGISQYVKEVQERSSRARKWLICLIITIMPLGLVNNLLSKPEGYNFQQDAVEWVANKNIRHDEIYYHDARLRYYAGAKFVGTWQDRWERLDLEISSGAIHHYHYLVLQVDPEDDYRLKKMEETVPNFVEVARFESRKRNKFVVVLENRSITN